MRKSQIALLAALGVGMLVTGVGAGAAFVEYSSMEYEGTILIGEEYWKTDTLTCEWEPGANKELRINLGNYPRDWNVELVEDESVPVGEVAVDVTYNEAVYEPYVSLEPVVEWTEEIEEEPVTEELEAVTEETETVTEETEPEEPGPQVSADRLEIWISYEGSDFEILMEHKDRILSMLRERKMASFETATVKEIKIRIHPDMMEYIKMDAE